MEGQIIQDCIARNIPVSEKSKPIDVALLTKMCDELLKSNTACGFASRHKLVQLWMSVARTGEIANSSWKTARWNNSINNLQTTWKEDKTGNEYVMNYFPDYLSFEMDFYHSMAAYLAVGGYEYQRNDCECIFPDLAGLKSAAKAIGDIFDKLREAIPDMDDATRKFQQVLFVRAKLQAYLFFVC